MSLLKLKDVSKSYGKSLALDRVNLSVEEGEILALVGPNGAGKTTLMKIMAGINKPSGGDVYFKGERVAETDYLRRRSTMVFQRTVLFNTDIYQNIAYGLKLRGYSRNEIEQRVEQVLDLVRLSGYKKKRVKELSGGEQQRVSLARALALDIDLLLLDEPTANLDPKNLAIIQGIISKLKQKKGLTVVIATHNILQAENFTDRVALLMDGRITEAGPTTEIFGEPSPNMKSFANFENIFHGESRDSRAGTSIISLGGGVEVEAVTEKIGEVTILIRPEDIILSTEPVHTSARNLLYGKVVEITDLGTTVRLKIDVGRKFVAKITKRSFSSMQLNIGSELYLAFKASAVYVL